MRLLERFSDRSLGRGGRNTRGRRRLEPLPGVEPLDPRVLLSGTAIRAAAARRPARVAAGNQTLTAAEVGQLLRRAAAASASNDAIIAVVDRGGNVLGVRVES